MKPLLLDKTIRLFLDSIGKREEYQYYLRRFHTEQSAAFAILCPDATGFDEAESIFEFDMKFLLRLDLAPLILLCGPEAVEMRRLLLKGDHFYQSLQLSHIPDADTLDKLSSEVREVHQAGRIAILSADQFNLQELLPSLIPVMGRRVHFIRLRGPLHSAADQPLYFYYTRRSDQAPLALPDQALAVLADHVLANCPGLHLSVASPWNLLQELFTVKGAGCVVRHGSIIRHITDITAIDKERLHRLVEESFAKPLRDPNYLQRVTDCLLEDQYRGAALLENHHAGRYLSKFLVSVQARGEGLANELWEEIVKDNQPLFWRARPGNPINSWYERRAGGWHDTPEWRVFWRKVDWRLIPDLIHYALERPDDFAP